MSCRPISVMTRYYSFYPLKSRNINNDFNNYSTCNHVSFLGLIMHLCFDSDSRKKRGKKREREGRKERKKRKKGGVIFSPTTHHSQLSQPHLALRHPPPTKLGEAKPARTPVCASGYDTVPSIDILVLNNYYVVWCNQHSCG